MKALIAVMLLATAALAVDNAVIAPQPATSLKPQATSYGAEAITIPQMLSYQGRLTDTLGLPVADTLYAVRFRLYAQPTGGTQFWEENQDVMTSGGLFSVLLGSVTPIGSVPDAGAAYLGMAVAGGAELTPRLRIASAAYAYKADTANYALAGGSGGDNAWVRSGSDSVLYTVRQLGIARGGAGNMLHGINRLTHVNLGVACTTGVSGQNYQYATVGGGTANRAGNDGAVVAGGRRNTASGQRSAICGGDSSVAAGPYSFIGGGFGNAASGDYAVVAGGSGNSVNATGATVAGGQSCSTEGVFSSLGGGYDNAVETDYGTIAGGKWNRVIALFAGALSGQDNEAGYSANDTATVVAGGWGNATAGKYSYIGGGYQNSASNNYSVIAGGWCDTAKALCGGLLAGYSNLSGDAADDTATVIAGGWNNSATGRFNFIGGGYQNNASNNYSVIAGGRGNTANGPQAAVGGGWGNTAGGWHSAIAGGLDNAASGTAATVSGGEDNQAGGYWSTVSGGQNDTAGASYAVVGGGLTNTASGVYSNVGGGYRNRASGEGAASVAGGSFNLASGACATIAGGNGNVASDTYAFVGGGHADTASGANSTVGGGDRNVASASCATVAGGRSNTASGHHSMVPGGYYCVASGSRSFAAGSYALARGQGSFVWSDSCSAADSVRTATSNRWMARARGGFFLFTNLGMTTGVYLQGGDNSWSSFSDSMNKENFRAVDKRALLEALAQMPVRDYNLKSQDPSIRHIAPVAQDFHNAFGFGASNTAINMQDADGVALAAIQALYDEVKAVRELNAAQQAEIEALKAELKRR